MTLDQFLVTLILMGLFMSLIVILLALDQAARYTIEFLKAEILMRLALQILSLNRLLKLFELRKLLLICF